MIGHIHYQSSSLLIITRVDAFVYVKGRLLRETFQTDFALEGLFARVDTHVYV